MGFEPTVSCDTTVFKTVALNHSATLPNIARDLATTSVIDKSLAEREGFEPSIRELTRITG